MGGNRTKLNYLRLFAFINPLMLLEIGAKPSIDLSDPQSIADAANAALTRLNEQKDPADDGGFNDAEMFWWMSAPVYDSVLEYSKWTGDTSFNDPAAKSLAAMSHGLHQNILYGEEPGVSDRRNDDIAWVALAVMTGVDIYGEDSVMPNTEDGKWSVIGPKTVDQIYQSKSDVCGGGLRWQLGSLEKNGISAYYKSSITNLGFISLATRVYLMNKDEHTLEKAKEIWDWITDASGTTHKPLIDTYGQVYDGVGEDICEHEVSPAEWTYNMGMALESAALLYKATGDEKYLDMATTLLSRAEVYGTVIKEASCGDSCGAGKRNTRIFKGIFVRSLVYLYRLTTKDEHKSTVESFIRDSVEAMVEHSCDDEWRCGSVWDQASTMTDSIDQSVSSSLLVAAAGVFGGNVDDGIQPPVNLRRRHLSKPLH